MTGQDNYISFFKKWFPVNKAKGLIAQLSFEDEFENGFLKKYSGNFYPGCWVISPKSHESHRARYAIFIHNRIEDASGAGKDVDSLLGPKKEIFNKIARFLDSSSFGVVYAVPYTADGHLDFSQLDGDGFDLLKWNLFILNGTSFVSLDAGKFFSKWRGGMRPRRPQESQKWDRNEQIISKLSKIPAEKLEAFVLKEIFYTGFLKSVIKVSTDDPYDVDSFIVSTQDSSVFPVELKEKSPVFEKYKKGDQIREHYFGIDSGRISCLERICSPNDANAFYVVREVEDGKERNLVKWKCMTLSGIIMAASWNAIGGGSGMFGSTTSTVKLPYGEFADLTDEIFSEENLKKISSRTRAMKMISDDYRSSLQK